MEFLLHVGLPKTGSSSLQAALNVNRERLRRQGVIYPAIGISGLRGIKHKALGKVLTGVAPRQVGMSEDWFERFNAEIAGADICILSDENFSGSKKLEVLTSMYPRCRIRVVMYVREPVAHAVSMYRHAVKVGNTTMSLRDFAQFHTPSYFSAAMRMADFYGKENIVIRHNERDDGQWNIVSDFANLIGLELDDAFPSSKFERNPGIAGNLLFVKRVMNIFFTREEIYSLIRGEMRNLAYLDSSFRGKIPVDQDTLDLIAYRSRESLESLDRHFRFSVSVREKPIEAPPSPDYGNLGRDFARILASVGERDGRLAGLLNRMAVIFALD